MPRMEQVEATVRKDNTLAATPPGCGDLGCLCSSNQRPWMQERRCRSSYCGLNLGAKDGRRTNLPDGDPSADIGDSNCAFDGQALRHGDRESGKSGVTGTGNVGYLLYGGRDVKGRRIRSRERHSGLVASDKNGRSQVPTEEGGGGLHFRICAACHSGGRSKLSAIRFDQIAASVSVEGDPLWIDNDIATCRLGECYDFADQRACQTALGVV